MSRWRDWATEFDRKVADPNEPKEFMRGGYFRAMIGKTSGVEEPLGPEPSWRLRASQRGALLRLWARWYPR